jgi:hypothetical protein
MPSMLFTSRQLPNRDGETIPFLKLERGEEPSVLAAGVSLLENLLDSLLGVLALRNLLEGIVGDGTLETLELESVASGHQVVVVDDLDEGLDLVSLLLAGLGHAAGDLGGVSLNAGNQGVAERVRLVAVVNGLDDDNLLSGVSAAGDDGDSADLEELHLVRRCVVCWLVKLRGVDKTDVWRLWTDFLISSQANVRECTDH